MEDVSAARLEFARVLRRFRLHFGITQASLGRRLHVATYTVNRWERALHLPQPGHYIRLLELPYMSDAFAAQLIDAYAVGYGRREP